MKRYLLILIFVVLLTFVGLLAVLFIWAIYDDLCSPINTNLFKSNFISKGFTK